MITGQELFKLMGVSFTATGQSWQFVPPKFFIGLLLAFVTLPHVTLPERLLYSLIFAGLLLMVLFLHILGHILSSKLVSPPMTEARITPILIETRYNNDPDTVPSRVHLIRSLGGPIMNLMLGGLSLIILGNSPSPALAFFAGANLVFTAVVLLPLKTVDGGVIWREVLTLIKGHS